MFRFLKSTNNSSYLNLTNIRDGINNKISNQDFLKMLNIDGFKKIVKLIYFHNISSRFLNSRSKDLVY